ncbi:lipid A biosynthesis lauroyl acyltransferase [Aquisphaera giovannonii]|uniref:Lipid A biosynthesis lauroyl acyltransferase n=1 Tax=Aquisphaera giovannonii TaxID=406548 RepID=A0A5B9VZ70_9BACT|nr:lysophospholipid acyltransferase family protein [Aquisphaera giovannonii]QEH33706.1 lipid A biosynthesis lauroyl acyltransferase [Aquisphaera giovannonii]
MERRGLNVRKAVLKRALRCIRWLPLTTASNLVSGFGRLEWRLHRPLRQAFDDAVGEASRSLGCDWDVPRVSQELAGNQLLWRSRDMLLDGSSDERALAMFRVNGKEHLDAALAEGKGCIVLTSHFGAHMLPAHWMYRLNYPLRLYMERPRSVSRFMARRFGTDGPLAQDKLFISRKGESTDAAGSILRATRVLRSGMILFLAGDVRWSGQMTETASFLGRTMRFSTTWILLAAMSGAPVVVVTCPIGPDRRYDLEFRPAFRVPADVQKAGRIREWVERFLAIVEEQIRLHPTNSNDYLFWEDGKEDAS